MMNNSNGSNVLATGQEPEKELPYWIGCHFCIKENNAVIIFSILRFNGIQYTYLRYYCYSWQKQRM